MSGLTSLARIMAALGVAATALVAGPALAQSVDYGGSNGRVHYDHFRDRGGDHHHHGRHHGRERHRDRDWHAGRNRNTVVPRGDVDGRPSVGGAYAGNVYGYDEPGNGTYFYVEGEGGNAGAEAPRTAPSARIVQPGGASACSTEAGVCVIRPGS